MSASTCFGLPVGSRIRKGSARRVTLALLAAAALSAGATQASAATPDAHGAAQVPAARPAVTAVSPGHGPEAGGGTVTVTGTGLAHVTAVTFGGAPAGNVVAVNGTTVTAIAPPHAHGTVDVTVTTPAGTSGTSTTDQYIYDEPAPSVTAVSPRSGVLVGGSTVTVTGLNLASTTAVMFGSMPASIVVVLSDTTVTAVAPPQAQCTVDVTVISPTGTSGTSTADQYTYGQLAPAVTALARGSLPGSADSPLSEVTLCHDSAVRRPCRTGKGETLPGSTCFRPRVRRGWARCVMAALLAAAVLSAGATTRASAATHDIYVANVGGSSVSVIDPTTNTVVATVPVGSYPVGVAITPDYSQAWVVNEGSNNVSVISTATNTVTATIPFPGLPDAIAFSPDGTNAYVAYMQRSGVGSVYVIDTSTDIVTTVIQVGDYASSIAVTPDGSRVYVANFVSNSVSVIDAATDTVVNTISGSGMATPTDIAITPDGTSAYVTGSNSSHVFAIDTETNAITAAIPTGAGPEGVYISPDGTRAYVANANADDVAVIDTATNTVTATIPAGSEPVGVLMSGTTAYVADAGSNTVSVIDTTTNAVTATIPVGSTPYAMALDPVFPPSAASGAAARGWRRSG